MGNNAAKLAVGGVLDSSGIQEKESGTNDLVQEIGDAFDRIAPSTGDDEPQLIGKGISKEKLDKSRKVADDLKTRYKRPESGPGITRSPQAEKELKQQRENSKNTAAKIKAKYKET